MVSEGKKNLSKELISDLYRNFASISQETINAATIETLPDIEKKVNNNYELAKRASRSATTRQTIYYMKDAEKQKVALLQRTSELAALKKKEEINTSLSSKTRETSTPPISEPTSSSIINPLLIALPLMAIFIVVLLRRRN